MGILANAGSIVLGTLLGSAFSKKFSSGSLSVFGISIMIISLVGFIENIFNATAIKLESGMLLAVVFSLITGTMAGEFLQIEDRLSRFSNNAFVDASLFFGIGGLQICGPVLLAVEGDNSQLFLKSMVDFPFALMFGATYGKITSLSAIPVAVVQLIIALASYFAASFFDASVIGQLCAIGYIILFFSGFNLMCEKTFKINNTNMLPGILVVILINICLKI